MALPPLVVSGSVIASTHINAIRNAVGSWSFAVEANGNQLHNVGPFNATTGAFSGAVTVSAALSATSLSTSGAVVAASATINGSLGAASAGISGNLAVGGSGQFNQLITALAGIAVTGSVTASAFTTTGSVSAAGGTFSGNVAAANLTTPGTLTVGSNAAIAGGVTCTDVTATGQVLLTGATFRYIQCESQVVAFYKKTGGNLKYYWRRSDTGRLGGGNEAEMMSLDDLGNLYVTAANPTVQILGTGTLNTGLRIGDVNRSYAFGINWLNAGAGKLVLYGEQTGKQMLSIDDTTVKIWIDGALRTLTVDANGFVKAT
jgi:hypothetical protein